MEQMKVDIKWTSEWFHTVSKVLVLHQNKCCILLWIEE